jgi:hypothetical protein
MGELKHQKSQFLNSVQSISVVYKVNCSKTINSVTELWAVAFSVCVYEYNIYSYVCVRGGPNQPLHRDPQWSIVLTFTVKSESKYVSLFELCLSISCLRCNSFLA